MRNKTFSCTKTEIENVLRKQLSGFKVNNLKYISSGWTSIIVDINDEYIAKFPRNKEKYNWLLKEANLLKILKKYTLLEVPDRILYDGLSPFFLHKKLKGVLPFEDVLTEASAKQRRTFFKSVAKFFQEVHSIPLDEVNNVIPTLNYIPKEVDIIPFLENRFDNKDIRKAKELIKQAQQIEFYNCDQVVGYFDFHGGNVVICPETYLMKGVFDFDEMAIRDFHFEFREVLLRYDEKYVIEIIKYYEKLTHRKVDMEKLWLLHIVWYLWEYSKMISNPKKIAEIDGMDVEFHKNRIKKILDSKYKF